jgi:hypothetical protein
MPERSTQQWYEFGRKHASSSDWLSEAERDRISAQSTDDLAAYDAGYRGGPRPPLSAEDVIKVIARTPQWPVWLG